jgi:hypothetical protein
MDNQGNCPCAVDLQSLSLSNLQQVTRTCDVPYRVCLRQDMLTVLACRLFCRSSLLHSMHRSCPCCAKPTAMQLFSSSETTGGRTLGKQHLQPCRCHCPWSALLHNRSSDITVECHKCASLAYQPSTSLVYVRSVLQGLTCVPHRCRPAGTSPSTQAFTHTRHWLWEARWETPGQTAYEVRPC